MKRTKGGFGSFIKRLDFYEEPVSLRFNGQPAYRTYLGAFLTFIILAVTVMHGVQLVDQAFINGSRVAHHTEKSVNLNIEKRYFPQTDTGFNLAFNLITSDG